MTEEVRNRIKITPTQIIPTETYMEAVGDLIGNIDYLLPLSPNAHLHDKIKKFSHLPTS